VKNQNISRREFLGAAAGVAAFTIVPRSVLGGAGNTPPSEKLNVACIGIGGMGASDSGQMAGEDVIGKEHRGRDGIHAGPYSCGSCDDGYQDG